MKINLDQVEIQSALIEYINNQGIDLTQKKVQVTLVAGRGPNGHSAQIDINPLEVTSGEGGEEVVDADDQQAIAFDFKVD